MCFEDIQVAIGTSKLLSQWGAISIFPLSFRSIEALLSFAASLEPKVPRCLRTLIVTLVIPLVGILNRGHFFVGGAGVKQWRNMAQC